MRRFFFAAALAMGMAYSRGFGQEAAPPVFPPHNYDQESINTGVLRQWYAEHNKTEVSLGQNIGIIRWLPPLRPELEQAWRFVLDDKLNEEELWQRLQTVGWGGDIPNQTFEGAEDEGSEGEPLFRGVEREGASCLHLFYLRTPKPQRIRVLCAGEPPHEYALLHNYRPVAAQKDEAGRLSAEIDFGFCLNLLAVRSTCRRKGEMPRFSLRVEGEGIAQAFCFDLDEYRKRQGYGRTAVVEVKVKSERIAYKPGESGIVRVKVINQRHQPIAGRLELKILSELNKEETVGAKDIALSAEPAAGRQPAEDEEVFSFPLTGSEGGREARAVFTPARRRPMLGRDFFLVTDRPLRLGQFVFQGAFHPDILKPGTPGAEAADIWGRRAVAEAREAYASLLEVFAWAPDDFALLAPPPGMDRWLSGQCLLPASRRTLLVLIEEARRQGMTTLTYCDKWIFGAHGFELARQHPDWFYWEPNWYGGVWDVRILDRWFMPFAEALKLGQPSELQSLTPLITFPEVEEHGTRQIVDSLRMFGWDGIRMDNFGWEAGITRNSDPCNAFGRRAYPEDQKDPDALGEALVRRLRAAIEQARPGAIYGDNLGYGWAADLRTAPRKALAEAVNGGMIMEESFNSWLMSGTASFAAVRDNLHRCCRGVRAAGGYPYVIGIGGNTEKGSDAEQKAILAMALASGAHSCSRPLPWLLDYTRLSVRYAEILYDEKILWWDDPPFEVKAEGAIWWREFVRVRPVGADAWQIIIHLINPPVREKFGEKARNVPEISAEAPPVREKVQVRWHPPAGLALKRAFLISPDGGLAIAPVEFSLRSGVCEVIVSRLMIWTIAVFEANGKLTIPANASQRQLAERRAPKTPTPSPRRPAPDVGKEKPQEEWLYTPGEMWPVEKIKKHGYMHHNANSAPDLVDDPTATSGKAILLKAKDGLRWKLYTLPPGTFRLSLRLRAQAPVGERILTVNAKRIGDKPEDKELLTVKRSELKSADAWQEYGCDFEMSDPCRAIFFDIANAADRDLRLDSLRIRLRIPGKEPAALRSWRIEANGIADADTLDGEASRNAWYSGSLPSAPPGRYLLVLRVKRPERGPENVFCHTYPPNPIFSAMTPSSFTIGRYEELRHEMEHLDCSGLGFSIQNGHWLLIDRLDIHLLEAYSEARAMEKSGRRPLPLQRRPRAGLQVWLAEGLFAREAGIIAACAQLKAEVVSAGLKSPSFALAGVIPVEGLEEKPLAKAGDDAAAPAWQRQLGNYDVAVLHDVPISAIDFPLRLALLEFVRQGGGLLVTGGMFGLDRGGYADSEIFRDLLPVAVNAKPTLRLLEPPAAVEIGANLSLTRGLAWPARSLVFWRHDADPKPAAQIILKASGKPLAVAGEYGKGRVAAILTPPYGAPAKDQRGFWETPAWTEFMSRLLCWLAGE